MSDEVVNSDKSKEMVLKWLENSANAAKLKGFEKIRKVHCITQNFAELGLTTTTFKLKRNECQAHFLPVLNSMYADMD